MTVGAPGGDQLFHAVAVLRIDTTGAVFLRRETWCQKSWAALAPVLRATVAVGGGRGVNYFSFARRSILDLALHNDGGSEGI